MNATRTTAYLNLIESDGIRRHEIASKFDRLREDLQVTRAASVPTASKFTLAGTQLDAVLGLSLIHI